MGRADRPGYPLRVSDDQQGSVPDAAGQPAAPAWPPAAPWAAHPQPPVVGYPGFAPPQGWPAAGVDPAAGPPPTRRRALWWTLLAAALLAVGVCAGGGFWVVQRSNGDAAVAATPSGSSAAGTAPAQEDTRRKEQSAVHAGISAALGDQARALLAGDRDGFVSVSDPGARQPAQWLAERFTTLRAMRIAHWNVAVTQTTRDGAGPDRWKAVVQVTYCFAEPSCPLTTLDLTTLWNTADRAKPRITSIEPNAAVHPPPPWALSELRAVVGSRTIVAATAANAGRMKEVAAVAEAAAKVADRFVITSRPARYVIYLAGEQEWAAWPDDDLGEWVAGYAMERTQSVVLQSAAAPAAALPDLLRHEMAHVATLANSRNTVDETQSWWLVEGIAEFVAMQGQPYTAYGDMAQTRRFVRSGWSGELAVEAPTAKQSADEVAGRYGVAYLAVRCLAERYGKTRLLGFFDAVAVDGEELKYAATAQLGVDWAAVSSTCTADIKRLAR